LFWYIIIYSILLYIILSSYSVLLYTVYCYILTLYSFYIVSSTFISISLMFPSIINVTLMPLNESRPIFIPYEVYYYVDGEKYFFYIFFHALVSLEIFVNSNSHARLHASGLHRTCLQYFRCGRAIRCGMFSIY